MQQEKGENISNIRAAFSGQRYEQFGSYILAFTISLILHISVFGLSSWITYKSSHTSKKPQVINVDLLYFPIPEQKTAKKETKVSSEEKIAAKLKKNKSKKKIAGKKKKTIRKKTRASNKKRVKHVLKPQEILAKARKKIKKEVEEKKLDPLATRISQLKQEVIKKGSNGKNAEVISESNEAAESKAAGIEERYLQKVRFIIRDNWTYPKMLTKGDDNLVVNINVTILPNGEITDTWFIKRSGNRYFDRSVSAAVMKSNPLPPFPPGLLVKSVPATCEFTLKDFMSR